MFQDVRNAVGQSIIVQCLCIKSYPEYCLLCAIQQFLIIQPEKIPVLLSEVPETRARVFLRYKTVWYLDIVGFPFDFRVQKSMAR